MTKEEQRIRMGQDIAELRKISLDILGVVYIQSVFVNVSPMGYHTVRIGSNPGDHPLDKRNIIYSYVSVSVCVTADILFLLRKNAKRESRKCDRAYCYHANSF